MFRLLLVVLLIVGLHGIAFAQRSVFVRGYYRKDGTYVRPHTRSSPGGGTRSYSSEPFAPFMDTKSTIGNEAPVNEIESAPTAPVILVLRDPRTAYRTSGRTTAPTTGRTGYQSYGPPTGGGNERKSDARAEMRKLAIQERAANAYRKWTDDKGKYSVIAKLSSWNTTDNIVELETKDDGKTVTVPFYKLSEADRKFLRHLQDIGLLK